MLRRSTASFFILMAAYACSSYSTHALLFEFAKPVGPHEPAS